MYQRNKGVFIILNHLYTPTDDNKVQQNEQVEFVDRLKNRHYSSATIILDLINKKTIKNRTKGGSFQDIIHYIRESYPEHFQSLLEVAGLEEEYKTDLSEDVALEAEQILEEIKAEQKSKKKAIKKKAIKKKAEA